MLVSGALVAQPFRSHVGLTHTFLFGPTLQHRKKKPPQGEVARMHETKAPIGKIRMLTSDQIARLQMTIDLRKVTLFNLETKCFVPTRTPRNVVSTLHSSLATDFVLPELTAEFCKVLLEPRNVLCINPMMQAALDYHVFSEFCAFMMHSLVILGVWVALCFPFLIVIIIFVYNYFSRQWR